MFEQHATLFFSLIGVIAIAGGYAGSVLHRAISTRPKRRRAWNRSHS